MSLISLLIASNFLCKYKYESQQYFSLHTNIITEPITTDYKFKHFLKVYFIASSFSYPSQQRNHEDNGFNKYNPVHNVNSSHQNGSRALC